MYRKKVKAIKNLKEEKKFIFFLLFWGKNQDILLLENRIKETSKNEQNYSFFER